MISVPVFDKDGKQTGEVEFSKDALGGKVRKRLLKEAVLMYEANKRRGTHNTKTRAEVAGTGAKMFRQKGTGRARAGQRQVNIKRGGGVVFGPRPRDYSYSINKRGRREALKAAFFAKMVDGEVLAIESFDIAAPKTKDMLAVLKNLGVDTPVLIGLKDADVNVLKSVNNIYQVNVSQVEDLNAYDVVKRGKVLLTRAALEKLKEGFSA